VLSSDGDGQRKGVEAGVQHHPGVDAAGAQADEPAEADPGEASDDMTRITLRLSGPLKARVDAEAAAAGLSVNAWLVRVITRALDPAPGRASRVQRGPGTRFTGYQRG
jgi:hypothetical protein